MIQTQNKIYEVAELQKTIASWKAAGNKVVFTNGCFDLVHLGHVDYLQKARNLGDKLVVALNTDASVSRIKGPNRPISTENSRARVMAAFEFVDAVVLFDEPTPKEVIEALCPDILTKGADYSIENIVGADFVQRNGGEVKTISFVEGFSTSSLIEKIKSK